MTEHPDFIRMELNDWQFEDFTMEFYNFRKARMPVLKNISVRLDYSGLDRAAQKAYDEYSEATSQLEGIVLRYFWSRGLAEAAADYLGYPNKTITDMSYLNEINKTDIPYYDDAKNRMDKYYGIVLEKLRPEQRLDMEAEYRDGLKDMWEFGRFAFVHGCEWGIKQFERLGFTADLEMLREYYKCLTINTGV